MRQSLDEHMARRRGAQADPDARGMRVQVAQLTAAIHYDQEERRLLESNATKFLSIALLNYHRLAFPEILPKQSGAPYLL